VSCRQRTTRKLLTIAMHASHRIVALWSHLHAEAEQGGEHVAPFQRRWDGLALNRCGNGVASLGYRLAEGLAQLEVVESHAA